MNWHLAEPTPALVAHPVAASLDEAHAAIELWEFYARKKLDGAQILSVEHMLAEADDGLWAASSTGRAESRQNGKGDEIEVVELWGLTQRGEAILHTAHEAATAASAHNRLRDLMLGCPDLRRRLGRNRRGAESVQSWNGNYRIEMADKSFIVHRTRTDAIGRGLDDISRLVVDEAQHAQAEELASATPILAANPNPQKNYIGSAGVAGKSAFWWRLRKESLIPVEGRFAWLEHSAEVVEVVDGRLTTSLGDINDRDLWKRANPAYPSRISDTYLVGQLRDLGPEHFAREHLCVWDPEPGQDAQWLVVAESSWLACARPGHTASGPLTYALDADVNASGEEWCSIAASDGTHVEIVNPPDAGSGLDWVLPAVIAKKSQGVLAEIVISPSGPAGRLIEPLELAGVKVRQVTPAEFVQACGRTKDAIVDGSLRHIDQPRLTRAVAGAVTKDVGDGAWRLSRSLSTVDVSPFIAVTLAFGLAAPVVQPPFVVVG